MNLSAPFIHRPVMTSLLSLALVLFGMLAYTSLPVSDLPAIDYPTVSVSASLPGAAPETMAAAVAGPLERQFATLPGLESINSTSVQGATSITLQFALERPIDGAVADVQAAIAAATGRLPAGMPNPPTFRKANPSEQPIVFLAVRSPTLPLSTVHEYAETRIATRISMVSGVAQVNVMGGQKRAIRVQMDPMALASRGLGLEEIAAAMSRGNVNRPAGSLNGAYQAFALQAEGQLPDAAAFRSLVVANRNGAPVRLGELGRVIEGVENDKVAGWYNGVRGIVLAVQRQPGSNTVQVAEDVLALLPELRAGLPASVQVELLFNRAEGIRRSTHDVQFTLVLTMALVVLVIGLFLRSLAATVIPSLALPLSVIATFGAMHLLGFSLNNLTLMALTLCTGFVVDDAIVMVENIVRRREAGEAPLAAALAGAREIGFTIVAMTLSLVAVFVPVLFMGGIMGRLFREFAVTISVAILVSALISLTLTPMLAARLLGTRDLPGPGPLFRWLLSGYDRSLQVVLRARHLVLGLGLGLLVVVVLVYQAVPKGFIPTEDTGQITVSVQGAPGMSFPVMLQHQRELMAIVARHPAVDAFMSSVGAGGRNMTGNSGTLMIRLKPRGERKQSAQEVVDELRPQLARVVGVRAFPNLPPALRIGGQNTRSNYQVTLTALDPTQLYRATEALERALKQEDDLQEVGSDLERTRPQVYLTIDRERAASLGISPEQIQGTLEAAYGPRQVTSLMTPTSEFRVLLEVAPEFQQDPDQLGLLFVKSSTGRMVPLTEVADVRLGTGPVQVNHLGQFPATTLSFNLRPGVSLSRGTELVEAAARRVVPSEVTLAFQGSAKTFQASTRNLGLLILLAIAVIYLVLGMLYENVWHPLTVLSGLPSAGLGALLTLWLLGRELDLYGFVGLLMLIGIVKKNAILMIDFALEAERQDGMSPAEAIMQACRVRFRPIMMTTMAALMGAVPIAVGWGAGGEARQSLGLAVVGGLIVSQVLTLYLTPVVYLALARVQQATRRPVEVASSTV